MQDRVAGDQLSNPLVDFEGWNKLDLGGWGSTLKPPGRLRGYPTTQGMLLGINSQTPW